MGEGPKVHEEKEVTKKEIDQLLDKLNAYLGECPTETPSES